MFIVLGILLYRASAPYILDHFTVTLAGLKNIICYNGDFVKLGFHWNKQNPDTVDWHLSTEASVYGGI